ncbi:MAG: glycosyltransferase family 2 protein [Muribaculaceae bacterium]|nr:glycosyltransferase family 2 protein [Muribaculaceae bacterium]
MLVSIIIPVYNSCRYVERCIRSVFDQTYQDLEIIIVDDCCKDDSVDIIKRVLIEYPNVAPKVRFIYHEFNQGCAASRRDGMKEATGKYIIQVDSDDYVESTMVEKLAAKAQEDDADMVVCNYYYTNLNRRTLVEIEPPRDNIDFVSKVLLGNIHAGAWNKMMRRSILKEHDIYPVAGINMGDDMTILVQSLFFMKNISYVSDALYFYNCGNENSLSRTVYPMVNDLKLINLFTTFFDKIQVTDDEIVKSFYLFRLGRLGRNLLYHDLNDVEKHLPVFNVTSVNDVFSHKRMPLHYKLIVFFYLKGFMPGVNMLRKLISFKKK